MKALILAGGEGKRLRPLTSDRPKPLLEVGGRPIIEWQIEWMKRYGIKSFVLSVGYMKEKMTESLGTGARLGVEISFEIEDEPLGTGGAIKGARRSLANEDCFVVANGDIITNFDLGRLISAGKEMTTLSLMPLRSPFGIVNTQDLRVTGFQEKPLLKDYWLNAGVYVVTKEIFDYLPDKGSLETETFPALANKGMLGYVKFEGVYWRSIDSFKDFEDANSDLNNKTVFG